LVPRPEGAPASTRFTVSRYGSAFRGGTSGAGRYGLRRIPWCHSRASHRFTLSPAPRASSAVEKKPETQHDIKTRGHDDEADEPRPAREHPLGAAYLRVQPLQVDGEPAVGGGLHAL